MHIKVDNKGCIYCKTCEMTCSYVKTGKFQPSNSYIREYRKDVSTLGTYVCKQCKEAACVKACKYGALTQGKKIVELDKSKCVNCGACYRACPYSAIWEVNGKAGKCDVCLACVKTCPRFVIKVDFNDPKR
jgi:Fe-S-cluster-containing hydrogenase component 2